MIPQKVCFTGLTVEDPLRTLQGRMTTGPIPPFWLRVRFHTEVTVTTERLVRWVNENLHGRWALWSYLHGGSGRMICVAFEEDADAVLFRIMDGERAWTEQGEAA